MVCVCTPLGLHPPFFFPEKAGRDYEPTPYLDVLKDFRGEFTVVSGLAHAGQSPGFAHQASASFLTGAQNAGRPGFRNSISLDQLALWLHGQPREAGAPGAVQISADGWTATVELGDNAAPRRFDAVRGQGTERTRLRLVVDEYRAY